MSTRIAHLSDLHIGPLPGFAVRHWNVKRALGYINWQRRRRHIHQLHLITRLVTDLNEQEPDHRVITGDLVNLGLPDEYDQAARWLEEFGTPANVSLVPGNHDIYTPLWTDRGVERWHPYMMSDDWGREITGTAREFPFVRRIAEVCIIGVNSAVPTPPAMATGLIGESQCQELERILKQTAELDLFRLVLIHHPPLTGLADVRRRLRDVHELEAVLADAGAELVIYGHNHRNKLTWLEAGKKRVPVIGIGSASNTRLHRGEGLGRYNLYDITRRPGGWTIDTTARGLARMDGEITELERWAIEV